MCGRKSVPPHIKPNTRCLYHASLANFRAQKFRPRRVQEGHKIRLGLGSSPEEGYLLCRGGRAGLLESLQRLQWPKPGEDPLRPASEDFSSPFPSHRARSDEKDRENKAYP